MGKTSANFILTILAEGLLLSLVTVGFLFLTGSIYYGHTPYTSYRYKINDGIVWFVLFAPAALACLIGKMRGIRNKWNICLGLGYYAAAGLSLFILCGDHYNEKDGLSVVLTLLVCLTLSWFCLRYLHGSKDGMFAKGGKDAA